MAATKSLEELVLTSAFRAHRHHPLLAVPPLPPAPADYSSRATKLWDELRAKAAEYQRHDSPDIQAEIGQQFSMQARNFAGYMRWEAETPPDEDVVDGLRELRAFHRVGLDAAPDRVTRPLAERQRDCAITGFVPAP